MNHSTVSGSVVARRLIDVPAEYERAENLVGDDALRKSIRVSGIQQPIVVVSKTGGRFDLIDGYRRLTLAAELGIDEVPCVIDQAPEGVDPKSYADRIRFILDEHRQDLFPSQRADLISKIKVMFRMTNKDVALLLGIDAGSITNWMAIQKYAPEIVTEIDAGRLTMFSARAFDGMTHEAQLRIYKKHAKDFTSLAGGKLHKLIRATYSPKSHPGFYTNPENTAKKLKIKKVGRTATKRPSMSTEDRKRLSRSLAMQETELRDGQEELEELKTGIRAATQPIRAILRDSELVAMLTDDQREEMERFAEVYV